MARGGRRQPPRERELIPIGGILGAGEFAHRYPDEMMRLGCLTAFWSVVEDQFCMVFGMILQNAKKAEAAYYSTVNFKARCDMVRAGQIAERHPGLKLIVDHMGVPRASKGEAAYRFQPELLALAKYPSVAVKATGQAGYAEGEYPFRSLHPHLHRCFDAFGPERMFWGTDITRMHCSWRQCITLFTEELPWLKARDLELVMGEALCSWMGWPLPAGGKGDTIDATKQ
jgi:hypothetical protein